MKRDIFFPEADIPVVVVPKTYPDGYTIGCITMIIAS